MNSNRIELQPPCIQLVEHLFYEQFLLVTILFIAYLQGNGAEIFFRAWTKAKGKAGKCLLGGDEIHDALGGLEASDSVDFQVGTLPVADAEQWQRQDRQL